MILYFAFVLFITMPLTSSYSQLSLEAIGTTGMNMGIASIKQDENSIFGNVRLASNFPGINAGGGVGARLYLFNKKVSIGTSINYLFRYHESNFKYLVGQTPNQQWKDHFLTFPIDFNYTLKNKVGFHLGLEMSWYLDKFPPNSWVKANKNAIFTPYTGISYTHKRVRIELLYKHSLQPFTWTIYAYSGGQDYVYTRYHDIELRVAVRIYEFKL